MRPRCTTSKEIRDGVLRRAIAFHQCGFDHKCPDWFGQEDRSDVSIPCDLSIPDQHADVGYVFWLSPLFRKALTKNITILISPVLNLISRFPRNGSIFTVLRSDDPDTRLCQTSRDREWPADESYKRNEPYFEVFLTILF